MTPFCFIVATVPLGLYWLALAWLHSRPQPFAVDGRRDFIALALALFGVFFIGPGSVTAPLSAMTVWGPSVWLLCGLLYICVVLLLSSLQRPRIVVYNATCEELRAALSRVALTLDDEARWAGASLNLPNLGVQLYIDGAALGRVATLVGLDAPRSQQGWIRLEKELRVELARLEAPRRRGWPAFAALGWGALIAASVVFFQRQEAIANALSFYLSV
ncbi:MAG: hypothetical protein IJE77_13475 [Thermoguttaceae bacterium]|nr:hypothetical protein [Thermoguttaceae bacterium]MBQ9799623.1 hypothetical protein [Thermoguttaceae bacterium]